MRTLLILALLTLAACKSDLESVKELTAYCRESGGTPEWSSSNEFTPAIVRCTYRTGVKGGDDE